MSESLWKSTGCSSHIHLSFVHGEWELSKTLICQSLNTFNRILKYIYTFPHSTYSSPTELTGEPFLFSLNLGVMD